MENEMLKTLGLLALYLIPQTFLAQSYDPHPCQKDQFYYSREKRKLIITKKTDSILIVLSRQLPPVDWWIPRTPPGDTKRSRWKNPDDYKKQCLVRIMNGTGKDFNIVQPDRALMLALQAKDQNGNWVDVEPLFTGICGNSFRGSYNDTLKSGTEWLTYTELFEGSVTTMYRLKFLIEMPFEGRNRYIYSNEIEGTIDICKFRKTSRG